MEWFNLVISKILILISLVILVILAVSLQKRPKGCVKDEKLCWFSSTKINWNFNFVVLGYGLVALVSIFSRLMWLFFHNELDYLLKFDSRIVISLIFFVLYSCICIYVPLHFISAQGARKIWDLSLKMRGSAKKIKGILIGVPLVFLASLGAGIVTYFIAYICYIHGFSLPVTESFSQLLDLTKEIPGLLIIFTIIAIAIIPIVEEIFYRGFIYLSVRKDWGIGKALIISSILFGAFHGSLISFIYFVFVGIVLAYLYEKSESLIPCIIAHSLFNTILLILSIKL